MKKNRRKYILLVISMLFMLILIKKINIKDLYVTIKKISIYSILFTVLLYNVSVAINAIKWKQLVRKISIKKLLAISYKAQFFSIVLPGQIFGEGAKIGILAKEGETVERASASVILDKITSLVGMVYVGGLGIVFSYSTVTKSIKSTIFIALILLTSILIILGSRIFYNRLIYIVRKFEEQNKIKNRFWCLIKEFIYAWGEYIDEKRYIVYSVIWGMVNQLIGSLQLYMLLIALGYHISFMDTCWITTIVSTVLLLPISMGGIGVRDISLSGILAMYTIPVEIAVTISFVMFLSQVSSAIIGGILNIKNVIT